MAQPGAPNPELSKSRSRQLKFKILRILCDLKSIPSVSVYRVMQDFVCLSYVRHPIANLTHAVMAGKIRVGMAFAGVWGLHIQSALGGVGFRV